MVESPSSSSSSSLAGPEPQPSLRDRRQALRLLKEKALILIRDQNKAYWTAKPSLCICASQVVSDILAKPEQWAMEAEALVDALLGCTAEFNTPILDYSIHLYLLSHCPLRLALLCTAIRSASAKLELQRLLEEVQYRRTCLGILAALEVLREDPRAQCEEVPDDTLEDFRELLRSSANTMGTPLVDDELTYDESWAEALAVAVEMVASISQRMLASAEDFGDFFVDDWARSKVDAMMAGHTRYPPKAAPLLLTFFRQWWTTAHKATRTKLLDDLAGRLIIHLRGTATARAIIHSLIEDPRSDEEFNLIARLEGSCKMPSPETVMAIVLTCSRAQWRVKAWQSCGVMSEGLVEVCRKAVLYDPDAQVRLAALRCLGLVDKGAVMESFRDTNYEVRQAALDISGPQALATCTCAHLVILALSEDDSGMIIHVESEILKRVEADSEQFLRDIRLLERNGEDTVLRILRERFPAISPELLDTYLEQPPRKQKHCQPPATRKRRASCAWRPWEEVAEQATPMRSLRTNETIEESNTPRGCSEHISSCGSSARAVAAACADLSEDDLNALAWW